MFFLAADLAQQDYFSIFGYAEENLTLPKGEGMDSIISKTFAYLQPHDKLMRLLWIVTRSVTTRAPWVIIKIAPGDVTYPSPI